MKIIAHRGLMDGPDSSLENTEPSIIDSLSKGYDVEIDLWYQDNEWYLGHDGPTHKTSFDFISQHGLWIHAKNFDAANKLGIEFRHGHKLNFFWHENDERTLTSSGYWWTFIGQSIGPNSITLLPERYLPISDLKQCLNWDCFGICTDYVNHL